jgi:hypothetical protein
VKKNISFFIIFICSCLSALANNAKEADLSETSLSASIDRRDVKSFVVALKKEQSEAELTEALKSAAANENLDYLKKLISEQKKAVSIIRSNTEIVLVALSEGSLQHLKILEKVADISAMKFDKKIDILRQSIQVSTIESIRYLAVKYPHMVSAVDDSGESILFTAVRRGDRKIVDEILKFKNLPTSRTNKKGESAESVALALGYKRIAAKVK